MTRPLSAAPSFNKGYTDARYGCAEQDAAGRKDVTEPAPAIPQREHRQRVLKGGAILTSVSQSVVTCTIRNMNSGGAEIKIPDGVHVPSNFLLYVAVDGIAYRCTVRWRRGDRAGLQFSGTEPKPRWYYG